MNVAEFHSSDLTTAVEQITDVFTGADGGGSFVTFCALLRELDQRALAGDAAAKQMTDIVRQFSRLTKLK